MSLQIDKKNIERNSFTLKQLILQYIKILFEKIKIKIEAMFCLIIYESALYVFRL